MKWYRLCSREDWRRMLSSSKLPQWTLNHGFDELTEILAEIDMLRQEFKDVIIPFVVSRGYPYDPLVKSFALSNDEERLVLSLLLSSGLGIEEI